MSFVTEKLGLTDFTEFFTELWGADKTPFSWQSALVERVLGMSSRSDGLSDDQPSGGFAEVQSWPDAIALPTGAGKTACIDIAVFTLAVRAHATNHGRGETIKAPRRIFFVVDRRIIVDEAHERARRLAAKLAYAKDGILKTVADRLRFLANGQSTKEYDGNPLSAHSLRGGMYRSEAWARNPLQPTIVASTVDQIGSRLLFRAYGRRSGTWPVYAGLIANDSLILLDEAHCAQPFHQTLQAVQKYRGWAETPLRQCFHPVVMSATPPPGIKDVFRDTSEEGSDPTHPLGRRQQTRKPAKLIEASVPQKATKGTDVLANELVLAAQRLLNGQRSAIVVFANRVATARRAYHLLKESSPSEVESILLTGRMRAVDRKAVGDRLRYFQTHSDHSADRKLEKPLVVVATQTLEVGADLDFDGLVTECASLDALRQRFGRLNRMGRDINCCATIVIRADQVKLKRGEKDDLVYGKALTSTWQWLQKNVDANGKVDFGIAAMEKLLGSLDKDALAEMNAPAKSAPIMLPAHVDCWAQTSPEPRPSPEVAPFLRGPQQGLPDVRVCWRADIDLSTNERTGEALNSLALCPPSSGETLPVPISAFRRWLVGDGDMNDISADVFHANEQDEGEAEETSAAIQSEDFNQADRRIIRWLGWQTDQDCVTSTPDDIRPGDVIVIPTRHPGDWRALGDLQLDDDGSVNLARLDVGDQSHRIARAKPILRLHKTFVSAWPETLPAKAAVELLDNLEQRYEENPDEVSKDLRNLLDSLATSDVPDGWDWLKETARELTDEFPSVRSLRREYRIVGPDCLVLLGRRRIERLAAAADTFNDEDDAAASGIAHANGRPVPLRTHLPGVEAFARRHALGCNLPIPLVEAVARAGLLHDVGKADPRFQALLRGGSPWLAGECLAKSAQMPTTRTARRRAREAARYPEGGRHELLSVRLAESKPAILPEDECQRDLVLHLVASHHGYCRPFAPVVNDADALEVGFELCDHHLHWSGPTGLERVDSGIAERYWRLTRRYGWWGLAWLEALLRLADWRRSEWEETHDAG